MKAAIYCRVSTAGQEEEGTSLDTQELSCRTHCATLGYEVVEVFKEARSGSLLWERRELQRMLDAMRRQEFGVIIAHSLDRLSRPEKVEDFFYLTTEARRHRCGIEFATETYDDTPTGKLMQSVFAFLAGEERRKITERTVRGRDAKLREGKLVTGGAGLYGYRKNKELGVREIYEPEAVIVRRMYNMYAYENLSYRLIAKTFTDEGVPRPRLAVRVNANWQAVTIRAILTNPAYMGETIALRWKYSSHMHDEDHWIRLPEGVTPPIVSAELWEAAQNRINTNKAHFTRNKARPQLLRGHIFCGVCERAMLLHSSKNRFNVRYYYWRCPSRTRADDGSCGNTGMPVALESDAWAEVAAKIKDRDFIEARVKLLISQDEDPAQLEAELEQARSSLAKISQRETRLLDLYINGDSNFSEQALRAKTDELAVQKQEAQARIDDLNRRAGDRKRAAGSLLKFIELCARMADKLDEPDFETKSLIMEALNVRAVWTKGALKVDVDALVCALPNSTGATIIKITPKNRLKLPAPQILTNLDLKRVHNL